MSVVLSSVVVVGWWSLWMMVVCGVGNFFFDSVDNVVFVVGLLIFIIVIVEGSVLVEWVKMVGWGIIIVILLVWI